MSWDSRARLISDPFDFRVTKERAVRIDRGGRTVTVVNGARAERLIAVLDAAADDHAQQQLLARATGHYKRGTE
ncbi:MAG: hypothetical protein ACR2KJ_06605 [Jatrophihabitans sp.]